jgi:hypothetical protein
MNLICQYMNEAENWATNVPKGLGTLLCVNAAPTEVKSWRSKGWQTRPLALSPGIADLWEHDSTALCVNPRQQDWTRITERFDALTWNDSCGLFATIPGLIGNVLQLLKPQGTAYLFVRNADYMKIALRASGREMLRWAGHSPCEAGITEAQVREGNFWPGYTAAQCVEIMDTTYQTALDQGHQRILGHDSAFRIPGGASAHRSRFIKGWQISLQETKASALASSCAPAQAAPAPAAPFNWHPVAPVLQPREHDQIQKHLELMEYEPAQTLLRQLFYAGKATAETYNLQGVWHFLQQQPTLAWENFKLAIDKDPTNLDFYYNLLDADKQCGKHDATRALLQANLPFNAELGGLLNNV